MRTKGKTWLSSFAYAIPALIPISMFVFFPFFKTIRTSLYKTNVLGQNTKFVGFDNYVTVFKSDVFRSSLLITFKYAIIVVFFSLLVSLILAIISNEKFFGRKFFRVVFSITMAVSSAAAAAVFAYLYHPSMGMLNKILGTKIEWLTSTNTALYAVAIVTIWLNLGMFYIFMLAGLQSIPAELYESAEIDGAGFLKKHISITLPGLKPTMLYLSMVGFINSFQSFAQIRLLTQGGPSNSTNVMMYQIYNEAFFYNRFSTACTMSVILFVILFIISFLQFKLDKKVEY